MRIKNRNRMAWCYGKVPVLVYLEREGSLLVEFRLGQDFLLGGTELLLEKLDLPRNASWDTTP